jgi:adenylate kinase
MGRRLLLIGPPGAGKGTQAAMLCGAVGIPHVSTGVMLRDHVARGTDLGREAAAIMEAGDLVPDEIVIAMVRERLAEADAECGFLLDGFPRTVAQAEALEGVLTDRPLEVVVSIEVPEDEVVRRILHRGELEGRADDSEETARNRMAVYREQTEPLLAFYTARGMVVGVDGVGSIDEVFARIALALAR